MKQGQYESTRTHAGEKSGLELFAIQGNTNMNAYSVFVPKRRQVCIFAFLFVVGLMMVSCANETTDSTAQDSFTLFVEKISVGYELKQSDSNEEEMLVIDSVSRSGKQWVREQRSVVRPGIDSVRSLAVEVVVCNASDSPLAAEIGASLLVDAGGGLRTLRSHVNVNVVPGRSTERLRLQSIEAANELGDLPLVVGPPHAGILSVSASDRPTPQSANASCGPDG